MFTTSCLVLNSFWYSQIIYISFFLFRGGLVKWTDLSRFLCIQKEICEICVYLKLFTLLKDSFLSHEVEVVTIELGNKTILSLTKICSLKH